MGSSHCAVIIVQALSLYTPKDMPGVGEEQLMACT
jgi:hypothetical protein